MNAAMSISTTNWCLSLAQKALARGYPAMSLELRNGRWCINLFCGFKYTDKLYAQWTTMSVQAFLELG